MTGEIEWLSPEPQASPVHPVDVRPRWPFLLRAAVLACAGIALAVWFAAPATTNGHGTAAVPPIATPPADSLFAGDGNLELVHSTAIDPTPLADSVRPTSAHDSCAQVMSGTPPQRSITAAIQAALPGYAVRDVGRTLDEFAALCNLTLRAVDANGSVLVISIAAPDPGVANPYPQITVSTGAVSGSVVTAAQAVTTTDWSVTVGTVGPVADQASVAVLIGLAENPAVRW